MSGESGGGNLSLTVAHKANREGWLHEIAGVYALCPFISNRWLQQPDDLPSLQENDGYFLSGLHLALFGSVYHQRGERDRRHLLGRGRNRRRVDRPAAACHLGQRTRSAARRGLLYYRRLLRAGVGAVGRVVAGTCHGGDVLCGAMPDVYAASLRDVSGFAKSVG